MHAWTGTRRECGSGVTIRCRFLYFAGRRELLRRATWRRGNAYRPGTQANVRSNVMLYAAFALFFDLQDFPATTRTLLAFGEYLLQFFKAHKSVLNALASVKHFHLDCGLPTDVFEGRELGLWRRALPLTVRDRVRAAPPLPPGVLQQLCELCRGLGERGLLFTALITVTFASMARLSSLLPAAVASFDHTRLPVVSDFALRSDGWALQVKWAKAHQATNQGFWVPLIPRPGAITCPVAALSRLLAVGGRGRDGMAPLFALREGDGRGGHRLTPLTMPVARAWLATLLASLGREPREFSFHSFRRGACTLAFRREATEADVMQLGGWRSNAVREYLPAFEARRRAAELLALS